MTRPQHRIPYYGSARPAWYGRPFPRIVLCPVSAAVRGNDGGQVTAMLYSYRVSWPCVSFTAINVHGCRMRGTDSALPRGAPPSLPEAVMVITVT